MPYVQRDSSGAISAVSETSTQDFTEHVEVGDRELDQFFSRLRRYSDLAETDLDFVRVLEDLLDVLLNKNVLLFTELPVEAQQKVLKRQALRNSERALDLLQSDSLADD